MASQYRRRSLMLNTIAKVAQGNPTIITDSSSRRLQKLNIYGQSSQDGTPSVENPIPIISKEVNEIKVTGKNLVDFRKVKPLSGESQPFEILDCGYIIDTTNTDTYRISTLPCALKAGKTYIINYEYELLAGSTPDVPCFLPDTEQYLNIDRPFIPKQDVNRIGIYLNGGVSAKVKITDIQLEESESSSEYEPYKEQVVNLTSPITLRGIPVDNGGNITIDGQQYISDYIDSVSGKINRLIGFIDSYNGEEVGTIFMSTTGQLTTGAKVIYKLSQPTQEDLPQQDQEAIRNLKTFYPNTVIQTGCWNEVTYSAKRGG